MRLIHLADWQPGHRVRLATDDVMSLPQGARRAARRDPRCGLMRFLWPVALVTLALLWAGAVLGVAFIAVPAQFAAALTRPQGIDITRQVFTAFGRIEVGLAAVTLVLALAVRPGRLLWSVLALLWLIVALQSAWLLPVLDARADQLLQGHEPAAGPWHGLFVGSEITKLVALLLIAWRARPASRSRTRGAA